MRVAGITVAVLGLIVALLLIFSGNNANTSTMAQADAAEPVPQPATAAQPPAPPSNWKYTESKNDVTGVVTKWACSESPDLGAELCFRKSGKKLESFVATPDRSTQFWCPEGCHAGVKIDDKPSFNVAAEGSETGSHMLFLEATPRLLASATKAKKIFVDCPFFEEGRSVLHFDVAGLEWKS